MILGLKHKPTRLRMACAVFKLLPRCTAWAYCESHDSRFKVSDGMSTYLWSNCGVTGSLTHPSHSCAFPRNGWSAAIKPRMSQAPLHQRHAEARARIARHHTVSSPPPETLNGQILVPKGPSVVALRKFQLNSLSGILQDASSESDDAVEYEEDIYLDSAGIRTGAVCT